MSLSSASSPERDRPSAPSLRVGGLVPLSTTDYPDHLSAVVFCQGCPWRCAYCHNPHLLPRRGESEIAWEDIIAFLERRRGLLDAVVFSGGEPSLQPALIDAVRAVKALGYKVGLHTAGMHPARLAAMLPLLDWIGMDIKTEFSRYVSVTGVPGSGERARRSMDLILASGVPHEFRTTMHAGLVPPDAVERIVDDLSARHAQCYVLQACRSRTATPATASRSRLDASLLQHCASRFESFSVRGL